MVMDHRENYFIQLRGVLSTVVAPIQYAVDWPLKMVHRVTVSISRQEKLIRENTHLRAEQLLLKAQVQKFIALEKENRQLRALLNSSPRVSGRVVAAELLAVDSSPYRHKIVLNKGTKDNVYIGQPVVDASGVVGQVIVTGPLTSQVLLLTDLKSAIPVQINHSGVRSIVQGTGDFSYITLEHIPKTTQVNVGDVLVTSGLDLRFPEGYPVGVVTSVEDHPGEKFSTIKVTPSAEINRSRIVLLVWPNEQERELEGSFIEMNGTPDDGSHE